MATEGENVYVSQKRKNTKLLVLSYIPARYFTYHFITALSTIYSVFCFSAYLHLQPRGGVRQCLSYLCCTSTGYRFWQGVHTQKCLLNEWINWSHIKVLKLLLSDEGIKALREGHSGRHGLSRA